MTDLPPPDKPSQDKPVQDNNPQGKPPQPPKPSAMEMVRSIHTGNIILLNSLLERGGDVNAKNYNNSPLITLAAIDNRPDIVALLIRKGASLDDKNDFGRTVLMCVARLSRYGINKQRQMETLRLLLDAGASLDIHDREGRTAEGYAREMGNNDIALILQRESEKRFRAAEEKARIAAEEARRRETAEKQEHLKRNGRPPRLKPKGPKP